MLVLPFGTLPGIVALGTYVSEVTVHTWDLASAIGRRVDWDDEVVLGALAGMQRGLPPEPRGAHAGLGGVISGDEQ